MLYKVCTKCSQSLPLSSYYKQVGGKLGVRANCKECSKKVNKARWVKKGKYYLIKSRYGLTEEEYDAIIERQQGKCKICSKVPKKPCLDHDHNTGRVRGMLCDDCNKALGLLGDNTELLESAIKYLTTIDN